MSTAKQPSSPKRSFLSVKNTRSRLDRVFIVRISPELCERVATAILENPALSGLSRSEFARRAMLYALESVERRPGTGEISG